MYMYANSTKNDANIWTLYAISWKKFHLPFNLSVNDKILDSHDQIESIWQATK